VRSRNATVPESWKLEVDHLVPRTIAAALQLAGSGSPPSPMAVRDRMNDAYRQAAVDVATVNPLPLADWDANGNAIFDWYLELSGGPEPEYDAVMAAMADRDPAMVHFQGIRINFRLTADVLPGQTAVTLQQPVPPGELRVGPQILLGPATPGSGHVYHVASAPAGNVVALTTAATSTSPAASDALYHAVSRRLVRKDVDELCAGAEVAGADTLTTYAHEFLHHLDLGALGDVGLLVPAAGLHADNLMHLESRPPVPKLRARKVPRFNLVGTDEQWKVMQQ
jgi:hypothetical protein